MAFRIIAAHLLPFANLLVMMKSQSLQLHSVKDGFGRRRFDRPKSMPKARLPDFAARLKKIHGEKVISAAGARAILDENKGQY